MDRAATTKGLAARPTGVVAPFAQVTGTESRWTIGDSSWLLRARAEDE